MFNKRQTRLSLSAYTGTIAPRGRLILCNPAPTDGFDGADKDRIRVERRER